MKYLTLILIGLLFPFMLFGQSENKDGTKYYGRYTYPSVDKPKIVFDLCPEGYFNFYKDKDAKSHQDIIHVEWKTE
ncbi:hypothetical protein LJB78_00795, partial [Bacteroidales bacterium OttesenSCG-928-J16]|nr:hypothetical protein [Bacteroidales bacterium OttesenSCG-928-J16]